MPAHRHYLAERSAEIVAFAELDTSVAEQRIDHRDVEEQICGHHLQIVLAIDSELAEAVRMHNLAILGAVDQRCSQQASVLAWTSCLQQLPNERESPV